MIKNKKLVKLSSYDTHWHIHIETLSLNEIFEVQICNQMHVGESGYFICIKVWVGTCLSEW